MTPLRVILLAAAAGLAALIVWATGSDGRPLADVLVAMAREPWTVVAMADLYLGFFISAAVIVMAESNLLLAAFWALPVFVLGNVWTALWLALRAPALLARLRS